MQHRNFEMKRLSPMPPPISPRLQGIIQNPKYRSGIYNLNEINGIKDSFDDVDCN